MATTAAQVKPKRKKLRRLRLVPPVKMTRAHARVMNSFLDYLPRAVVDRDLKKRLRASLEPLLHGDVDVQLKHISMVDAGKFWTVASEPVCAALIGIHPRPEKALLEIDPALAHAVQSSDSILPNL